MELLLFLQKKFKGRVSVERVVSGGGLENIFEFFCNKHPHLVNHSIVHEMNGDGEIKGQIISKYADLGDSLCQKTIALFVEAYGAEAGLTCLKFLPYGGLYLAGGLTPKIINHLRGPTSSFRRAMLDKGRLSSTVEYIPVLAVLREDLAERGCFMYAYYCFVHACSLNILGNVLRTSI